MLDDRDDFVESILVPGATISGFNLPSSMGPLEEKAAIPLELFDGLSLATGFVVKSAGQPELL